MHIDRLFGMVYWLIERGGSTAEEMAQRFEVSKRTIYRDVELLSQAGIPVFASRGKGGGIRILEGYRMHGAMLTRQEQGELLFALEGMNATRTLQSTRLLSRMRALFRQVGQDYIEVDFHDWGSGKAEYDNFTWIKQAILENRLLRFAYFNTNGQNTVRTVEPMKLIFKNTGWYLCAFCLQRQALRLFRITRMQKVELTQEYFTPRPMSEYPWKDTPPVQWMTLKLRFSHSQIYRVLDQFDHDEIVYDQDGSLIVTTQYPDSDWVKGHILSFGKEVEVLFPQSLRRQLAQEAREIVERYQQKEEI